MNRGRLVGLITILVAAAAGALLIHSGQYAWTLFVAVPAAIGFAGAAIKRPRTALGAAGSGAAATFLVNLSLLVLGKEGLGCLVMAWVLVVPLGVVGGLLHHWLTKVPLNTTAMLLLLPLSTGMTDYEAKPRMFEVTTTIEVAASPEQIWKHVIEYSELPEPQEWYFQAGLAYPKRVRIDGYGVGSRRNCEFSTGPFVETIDVWDEPRLLQFEVLKNPEPMREWSPYGNVHPKHLDGYMLAKRGRFTLTPIDATHTRLQGTTLYQHGFWPAQYWRLWSDAAIHRIHLRVLRQIKIRAEQGD
jgi:hypothetical protein